ncbi:sensor histidine kinase [Lacisediminimonas profundi]|uniref:sensor histidine kinase n=1 Tax=Lacisediminimonas profundi TaxID=2603856 RepID=UPI00124B354A|nr:ATP-binding protein [Lacisediminimonas profundi]
MNSDLRRSVALLGGSRNLWRWLLPLLLLLLFLATLLWLPWQAQRIEASERREQLIADTLWVEQTIRFQLSRNEESMRLLANDMLAGHLNEQQWRDRVAALLRNSREVRRLAWLDADGEVRLSSDGMSSADLSPQSKEAGESARKSRRGEYSVPAPQPGLSAPMLMDYHLPMFRNGRYAGSLVASYPTSRMLDELVPWWFAQDNEIALIDNDEAVIDKRAAGGPGRNVYTHTRALDLPGVDLSLRTNSLKGAPGLLPNLLVGSVIALSLSLAWSLAALWRDIRRRLAAEGALRQQVSFRSAMENSLLTGLRARDLEGRITYVNPAFCEMVGLPASELVGKRPPMPYWAPEAMEEYQGRFTQVLAGHATPQFETVFQRSNGERFPVLVFESPLMDGGRQTGWMSSLLDISELRRVENLSRQQQEQLQASARLASMGEIASTLAHELNQPLAAISSYTTGVLNLLDSGKPADPGLLRDAVEKANQQAQRAGHIIRSVHAFVKKRAPAREAVDIGKLVESLLPLVELQAREAYVSVQLNIEPGLPPVLADSVMLEQVVLNLTRNGIESMLDVAPERRSLRVAVRRDSSADTPAVEVLVTDRGHGIPEEVAERLFSPFFSTKAEGMGMGLNICRTVVESHGGTLTQAANPGGGTVFRFSIPATAGAQRRQ